MIPSCVPHELQNLTQIEEMLIARALPIMRVYIKPGENTFRDVTVRKQKVHDALVWLIISITIHIILSY
jgi:hypothetical protein